MAFFLFCFNWLLRKCEWPQGIQFKFDGIVSCWCVLEERIFLRHNHAYCHIKNRRQIKLEAGNTLNLCIHHWAFYVASYTLCDSISNRVIGKFDFDQTVSECGETWNAEKWYAWNARTDVIFSIGGHGIAKLISLFSVRTKFVPTTTDSKDLIIGVHGGRGVVKGDYSQTISSYRSLPIGKFSSFWSLSTPETSHMHENYPPAKFWSYTRMDLIKFCGDTNIIRYNWLNSFWESWNEMPRYRTTIKMKTTTKKEKSRGTWDWNETEYTW